VLGLSRVAIEDGEAKSIAVRAREDASIKLFKTTVSPLRCQFPKNSPFRCIHKTLLTGNQKQKLTTFNPRSVSLSRGMTCVGGCSSLVKSDITWPLGKKRLAADNVNQNPQFD
jgi:hypothetical protein